MDQDLGGLESKVAQVISLCADLRTENNQLRMRVSALEDEKQALTTRMTTACARIEGIVEQLPPE